MIELFEKLSKQSQESPITISDLREVMEIEGGSDATVFKAALMKLSAAKQIPLYFAERGGGKKTINSKLEVSESGLFISIEELDEIGIGDGDRVLVKYKKARKTTKKGEITYNPPSITITKIIAEDGDWFTPSVEEAEVYVEEEEMSEEEEMLNA